jgi:hypothetical protein
LSSTICAVSVTVSPTTTYIVSGSRLTHTPLLADSIGALVSIKESERATAESATRKLGRRRS